MNDIELRDYFAAMTLQGAMAFSMPGTEYSSGDVFDPGVEDEDFAEASINEGAYWYKDGTHWICVRPSNLKSATHKLVASYEDRVARYAYKMADAMMNRRNQGSQR